MCGGGGWGQAWKEGKKWSWRRKNKGEDETRVPSLVAQGRSWHGEEHVLSLLMHRSGGDQRNFGKGWIWGLWSLQRLGSWKGDKRGCPLGSGQS